MAKSLLQDDFGSPSHLAAQLLPYLRRFSFFYLFYQAGRRPRLLTIRRKDGELRPTAEFWR
jgi:hypothetical protein